MDLARQAAAKTAQSLFALLFGRPSRMLIGPYDGAVDENFFEVDIFSQEGKDVLLDILVDPAGIANIDAVLWTEYRWKIAPLAACTHYPQYRFNNQTIVFSGVAMVASFSL